MLARGSRFATYEVLELLGAGGMGEVYRARDLRLGRDVALKVLPERLLLDAGRRARFEREARVLASLNHPNITTLYGIAESDGVLALALELVEGETLDQRLSSARARGAGLPLKEVLTIARQIVAALDVAHERGVIHRDLKPANIALGPDMSVKLLDFGLAKALEAGTTNVGGDAPTMTVTALEAPGTRLGTSGYMSPEQACGESVDSGTDIWAFGCVLFEMLTGHPAFARGSASDTLAQVLAGEPDFGLLPASTPPLVARLVRRCLEKDRRARLRHIADASADLSDTFTAAASDRAERRARVRSRAAWSTAAAAAALLVVAVVIAVLAPRSTPMRVVRTTIPVEPPATVSTVWRALALTVDGTRLAYVGAEQRQIFIRPLDAFEAESIVTVGEGSDLRDLFLSPDGTWIGFIETSYRLRKVPVTGGAPFTVLTLDGPSRGATWAPDNTIVYATAALDTGLQRISADGGSVTVLTRPNREQGEGNHLWPDMVPDGRGVLFTITAASGDINAAQIAVLDLVSGVTKTLIRGGHHARYVSSGHLVYASGSSLRAIAFDARRLATSGTPVTVVPRVVTDNIGHAAFTVSPDGSLAYLDPPPVAAARSLVWVDRNGRESPLPAPPGAYANPRISPRDETRFAVRINDDLWVWDLERPPTQLTATPFFDWMPLWMPDGEHLLYGSWRAGGLSNVYAQRIDGSGPAQRLSDSPHMQLPSGLTPDGSSVLFTQASAQGYDLYVLKLDSGEAVPLLATPADERNAVISPDTRWIAYESNSANTPGQLDVYVRPFPVTDDGGVWQVSAGGGTHALWSRNGDELFYLSADGAMVAVPVETSGNRWLGSAPVRLFDGPYYIRTADLSRHYDVTADGQRFLMIRDIPANSMRVRIVLVQNFSAELNARVPR